MMKISGKHKLLAQIARRGLLLTVPLAMMLLLAAITRGQSNTTTTSAQEATLVTPPEAKAQTPAALIAKPISARSNAPGSPEGKPSAKAAKEGIAVHGHWTIDVKNPDGTIVSHQDFENGIDSVEGADALTGFLSGEYVPLGFAISLAAPGSNLCQNGIFDTYTDNCQIVDSRNSLLGCNSS